MNLHIQFDFSAVALNENILPHLRGDAWFQQAALERTMNELAELKERMDRFDDRRLQLAPELASLLARQPRLLARPMSKDRVRALEELRDRAYLLKGRLSDAYHSFLRRSYRRYLPPETGFGVQGPLVEEMRNNLVSRFESIIKLDVEKCLDVLEAFIRRCHPA